MSGQSKQDRNASPPPVNHRRRISGINRQSPVVHSPQLSSGMNVEDHDVFYVEKILDKRTVDGQIQYLINWTGYPDSENTWEPRGNINSPFLIAEFERSRLNGNMNRNIGVSALLSGNINTRARDSAPYNNENTGASVSLSDRDTNIRDSALSDSENIITVNSASSDDGDTNSTASDLPHNELLNTRDSLSLHDGDTNSREFSSSDDVDMITRDSDSPDDEDTNTRDSVQPDDELMDTADSIPSADEDINTKGSESSDDEDTSTRNSAPPDDGDKNSRDAASPDNENKNAKDSASPNNGNKNSRDVASPDNGNKNRNDSASPNYRNKDTKGSESLDDVDTNTRDSTPPNNGNKNIKDSALPDNGNINSRDSVSPDDELMDTGDSAPSDDEDMNTKYSESSDDEDTNTRDSAASDDEDMNTKDSNPPDDEDSNTKDSAPQDDGDTSSRDSVSPDNEDTNTRDSASPGNGDSNTRDSAPSDDEDLWITASSDDEDINMVVSTPSNDESIGQPKDDTHPQSIDGKLKNGNNNGTALSNSLNDILKNASLIPFKEGVPFYGFTNEMIEDCELELMNCKNALMKERIRVHNKKYGSNSQPFNGHSSVEEKRDHVSNVRSTLNDNSSFSGFTDDMIEFGNRSLMNWENALKITASLKKKDDTALVKKGNDVPINDYSDESRFRHGFVAQEILGATNYQGGEMMYVIKWKNIHQADLVSARLVKELWPQVVISFYQGHLHFHEK